MIALEFLIAFIIAIILSALLVFTTEKRVRKRNLLWLFLVIFLFTWAGGIWMLPVGPELWGVRWMSFFAVGLAAALLFAAFSHRRPPRDRKETLEMLDRIEGEKELEEMTYITLSLFFWIVLIGLMVAIIFGYIRR